MNKINNLFLNFILDFTYKTYCSNQISIYSLVNKNWYLVCKKNSYLKKNCSLNYRYNFPYCKKHFKIIFPEGSVKTFYPNIYSRMYKNIQIQKSNRSYHFYNYQEVKRALRFFNQFPYFINKFERICCNYSGITMKIDFI